MSEEEKFIPLWHCINNRGMGFEVMMKIALNLLKAYDCKDEDCVYDNLTIDDILVDVDTGTLKLRKSVLAQKFLLTGFASPQKIKQNSQNEDSDELYTLSVLLFYLFYRHHPLEGRRFVDVEKFSMQTRLGLYGELPLYIFDPDDQNNHPVAGKQDIPLYYRKVYPKWFQQLFEVAFTKGLQEEQERIPIVEWEESINALSYHYTKCPNCQKENFIEWEKEKNICFHCHHVLSKLPRLELSFSSSTQTQKIMMSAGSLFYIKDVLLEVVKNPKDPKILGLKNQSEQIFKVVSDKDKAIEILPQKSFPLKQEFWFIFDDEEVHAKFFTKETSSVSKPILKKKVQKLNPSDENIKQATKEANNLKYGKTNIKQQYQKVHEKSYPRFRRDDSAEIVIDSEKNLIWQDSSLLDRYSESFKEAQEYAENLNLGGYNDWRLPKGDELDELFKTLSRAEYQNVFKFLEQGYYVTQFQDPTGRQICRSYKKEGGLGLYPEEKHHINIICVREIILDKEV